MLPAVDEIVANFELLDDWEERYRYLIELGRMLPPLAPEAHSDANKVQGCASQVWLERSVEGAGPEAVLCWRGDSDAHIVRGLIALLLALYSGKRAQEVLAADALGLFRSLGLSEHLTPQRSNGVRSMVERIRGDVVLVASTVRPQPRSRGTWERDVSPCVMARLRSREQSRTRHPPGGLDRLTRDRRPTHRSAST